MKGRLDAALFREDAVVRDTSPVAVGAVAPVRTQHG
jgi:hypothetical protein